jgi:hypothetical protein
MSSLLFFDKRERVKGESKVGRKAMDGSLQSITPCLISPPSPIFAIYRERYGESFLFCSKANR